MKYADLHVHTDFSDGTFTPEEVVRTAKDKGLSAIAICDHDCVDGIKPARESAKNSSLEIIPAIELTVIKNGREIHMLGYFISWQEEWLSRILKRVQEERVARIDKMIEKLKRFKVKVDREKVLDIAGRKGSVGRLHLARALFETGAVYSIQAVFNKYLGDSRPCYVEDIGFGPKEAIELILKANGVPVLAHPGVGGVESFTKEFVGYGLRGIETFHTDHSRGTIKRYEQMAAEYGIIATGGSDCHGLGKGRVLMGGVKVPYTVVEELKKEAERIKRGTA